MNNSIFKTAFLLVTLLFLTFTSTSYGQQQERPESIDIVREGYWNVISPDTTTNHTDAIQSIERILNLTYQGIPADSIHINPPRYVVRQDWTTISATDTVYLYDPEEPVYVNEESNFNDEVALTNGIYWQFKTDSTQGVQLKLFGQTPAEKVSVGIKCVGVDDAGMFTDQRTGFTMQADSSGVVQGSSKWLDKTCNQFMTYWLTAYTQQDTARVSRFVDVGEDWSGREQF